jgi:hypothetical protein
VSLAADESSGGEGLSVAFEVRKILTPDQLAQGAQLWEQMQAMRAQMRDFFEEKP